MELVHTALLLVAALQIKHLIADFFLQTAKMLAGRDRYLHSGRAQHAGIHAVFSALVLLAFGTSLKVSLLMALAEFVIHFHIDWGKARHGVKNCLAPDQAKFWHAMGTDQALHHLTYIAMVWIWVGL